MFGLDPTSGTPRQGHHRYARQALRRTLSGKLPSLSTWAPSGGRRIVGLLSVCHRPRGGCRPTLLSRRRRKLSGRLCSWLRTRRRKPCPNVYVPYRRGPEVLAANVLDRILKFDVGTRSLRGACQQIPLRSSSSVCEWFSLSLDSP